MLAENYETAIINLGTCSLHKVNSAFGNAVAQICKLFGVDQFAIDVYIFFKHSVGRGDFPAVGEVTDAIAKY